MLVGQTTNTRSLHFIFIMKLKLAYAICMKALCMSIDKQDKNISLNFETICGVFSTKDGVTHENTYIYLYLVITKQISLLLVNHLVITRKSSWTEGPRIMKQT